MAAREPQANAGLTVRQFLWLVSDHARLCLIAGLLGGLALPGLAAFMQPWLPEMVGALLCITALRLGHRAVLGAADNTRVTLIAVLVLQMALPLALFGLGTMLGLGLSPVLLAAVLVTAAPSISGAPNLALLLRQDAGASLRIMAVGTALFPLTVLPLLAMMPQLGSFDAVVLSALRVMLVIAVATAAGFALRHWLLPNARPDQIKWLDGLSVLAFSGIVVGLMAAITPALKTAPLTVLQWAALAFVLGYGLQVVTYVALKARPQVRGPLAIAAGNRNIALFLVALPEQVMAPVMVFIGCWQLPMYLTPILMRRLYVRTPTHE
ncbi:MAG: hypothetical protein AB8B58_10920 [Roseobacter sp.]